jgi:DNA transformation protein
VDAEGILDLFEPFGPVRLKRMFSGHGVFADDLCFSLVLRGEVYMKADTQTQGAFEAAGSRPFTYTQSGRGVVMTSFWLLPPEAFDDPDELRRWCDLALAAARRFAAGKRPKAGSPALKKPAAAKGRAARPRKD